MRNASVRLRCLEGGILVEPWLEIRVTAGACLCPSCTSNSNVDSLTSKHRSKYIINSNIESSTFISLFFPLLFLSFFLFFFYLLSFFFLLAFFFFSLFFLFLFRLNRPPLDSSFSHSCTFRLVSLLFKIKHSNWSSSKTECTDFKSWYKTNEMNFPGQHH